MPCAGGGDFALDQMTPDQMTTGNTLSPCDPLGTSATCAGPSYSSLPKAYQGAYLIFRRMRRATAQITEMTTTAPIKRYGAQHAKPRQNGSRVNLPMSIADIAAIMSGQEVHSIQH